MSFIDFDIYQFEEQNNISFTGGNEKNILIFLKIVENSAENKDFLRKVMKAAHLEMDTDCKLIVVEEGKTYSFGQGGIFENNAKVFSFGIPLSTLGLHLNVQKYQPISFNDTTILWIDDLTSIQKNKQLKGGLWNCLKHVFNI